MKKNYESPMFQILGVLNDEYCAEDTPSVADTINYKQLNKTTLNLDLLEDWSEDGE